MCVAQDPLSSASVSQPPAAQPVVPTATPVVITAPNLVSSPTPATPASFPAPTPSISAPDEQALAVLDQVLTQAEQKVPPIPPQAVAVLAQPVPLVSPTGPSTAKETLVVNSQEIAASGPVVEQEPNPEIAPEVESYIEKVESHPEQIPHEVVLSGQDMTVAPIKTMTQPVIVLPITPEIETAGAKKSPAFSIRWLVEWSRRIMRLFSGKVIYRQD